MLRYDESLNTTITEVIREKLREGIPLRLGIHSGSMAPLIKTGSTVEIHAYGTEAIQVDDIVCYRMMGGYVIHRVVSVNVKDNLCVTQGDMHLESDEPVALDQIIGRVTEVTYREETTSLTSFEGKKLARRARQFARARVKQHRRMRQLANTVAATSVLWPLSALYEGIYRLAAWWLVRKLQRTDGVITCYLGGSAAISEHIPGASDLDFFVVVDSQLSGQAEIRLLEEIIGFSKGVRQYFPFVSPPMILTDYEFKLYQEHVSILTLMIPSWRLCFGPDLRTETNNDSFLNALVYVKSIFFSLPKLTRDTSSALFLSCTPIRKRSIVKNARAMLVSLMKLSKDPIPESVCEDIRQAIDSLHTSRKPSMEQIAAPLAKLLSLSDSISVVMPSLSVQLQQPRTSRVLANKELHFIEEPILLFEQTTYISHKGVLTDGKSDERLIIETLETINTLRGASPVTTVLLTTPLMSLNRLLQIKQVLESEPSAVALATAKSIACEKALTYVFHQTGKQRLEKIEKELRLYLTLIQHFTNQTTASVELALPKTDSEVELYRACRDAKQSFFEIEI